MLDRAEYMRAALPLLLLLAGCEDPIECDASGYRVTPEGASLERQVEDVSANSDLMHNRTMREMNMPEGRWLTRDSLEKADGCP